MRHGLLVLSLLSATHLAAQEKPTPITLREPLASAEMAVGYNVYRSDHMYNDRLMMGLRYRPCLSASLCLSTGAMLGQEDVFEFKRLGGGGTFLHVAVGADVKIGPVVLLPSIGQTSERFPSFILGYYGFVANGLKVSLGPVTFVGEHIFHTFRESTNGTTGIHDTRLLLMGRANDFHGIKIFGLRILPAKPLAMGSETLHTRTSKGQPGHDIWTSNITVGYDIGPYINLGTRPVLTVSDASFRNEALRQVVFGWRVRIMKMRATPR